MLSLARLDRRDTATIILSVAGHAALPSEIVKKITERSDGVPLFIEELTKSVLESGYRGTALAPVPNLALSVPAKLHASLLARPEPVERLSAAGKRRDFPGCGRRSTSPGFGATRADGRKPVICSVHSTIGSPRVSMRPI
jgi:hypothetical protein